MENHLINLLKSNGYQNEGDNRSYDIRSINTMIDAGMLELKFVSYEDSKTQSFRYEFDGKPYTTLYKIKLFGKWYAGHIMPKKYKDHLPYGMGTVIRDIKYETISTYDILIRVATIISKVRNGFDFIKDGNCNCAKCSGKGIIPAFMHYANGICFDCGGTGIDRIYLKNYIASNIKIIN